ncbi:hypothetical protein, partial [Variovorax sp. Varisp36]|uniref:hypothetical protein n=1 Tax=Variovorax sp. Varisp36 TaxID=3243031 RepID=UPI0039A5A1FC
PAPTAAGRERRSGQESDKVLVSLGLGHDSSTSMLSGIGVLSGRQASGERICKLANGSGSRHVPKYMRSKLETKRCGILHAQRGEVAAK